MTMETTKHHQFAGIQNRALEVLERGAWGDLEYETGDVEVALQLEATEPWRGEWEDSLEGVYGESSASRKTRSKP